jgi:5,10-methenyltetrahydrofolate synthetase
MESEKAPAWNEVRAWRKAERARLIAAREATPPAERNAWNERIGARLFDAFRISEETIVGYCWPYRGEFDARFVVRRWRERGALAALPAVVDPKGPLEFRKWWPGAPMKPGVYDIPVPDGTEVVVPDVAIVPMNAFDGHGYRLGYGGGYFDRTLAACGRRLVAIGIAYEMLRVETIHPQAHDMPMDFVVTESAVYSGGGEALTKLDTAESRRRFEGLLIARRLPRAAHRSEGYSSPACYAADFPGYFGESEKE